MTKNYEEELKKEIRKKYFDRLQDTFPDSEDFDRQFDCLVDFTIKKAKSDFQKKIDDFDDMVKDVIALIEINDYGKEDLISKMKRLLKEHKKEIFSKDNHSQTSQGGSSERKKSDKSNSNKKIDEFKNICKFDKNFNNFIKNILKENKEEIEKLPKKVDWINPLMNFSRLVLEKYNKKFEEIISKEDNQTHTAPEDVCANCGKTKINHFEDWKGDKIYCSKFSKTEKFKPKKEKGEKK